MAGTMQPAELRQLPQSHPRVVGLHCASATAAQPVGQTPLVLKQPIPAVPVHAQHTGGGLQSQWFGAVSWHCDPGGNVGGQGPVQPVGDAESKWQIWRVVVVVLVVLVVLVVVAVVVLTPTTALVAGAQISRGLPTGTLSSWPN